MILEDYFNELVEKGLLRKEKIGVDQVKALLRSAGKNVVASRKILEIDEEASYLMAYNAMLKMARAIVFLHHYRPDDGQQHKTTVAVAGKILGSGFSELIDRFDRMRKKRNQVVYESLLPISQEESNKALKTAEEFYRRVKQFLEEIDQQRRLF